MDVQRFRQIHLDYHTSPFIEDVGTAFEPAEFAKTLKEARVNSVNIFAKCHHGYSYYPTKVGTIHPHLKFDLLGHMIEALHREGISCPIYFSITWDELACDSHADWRQVDTEGKLVGRTPLGSQGWRHLCMNSPYMDYVEAQIIEIMDLYNVDGFWFDIVAQHPDGCLCNYCLDSMQKKGFDFADSKQRLAHNLMVEREALDRLYSVVKNKNPRASVFQNCRMRMENEANNGIRPELEAFTHLEIESLPSGDWGYLHFPMYARYCQTLNMEVVGMNGRFHLAWGDFGGLKNSAALEYECNRMLAFGAKISIGDQLHPRGRLERATYERIGRVFEQVELKEPYCTDVKLQADIGVYIASESRGANFGDSEKRQSDEGVTRMLMELHHQFHFLDGESDLTPYKLVIAPDEILFDHERAAKVQTYLESGGALLLTNNSGLNPQKTRFAIDDFDVKYLGSSEYDVDYLRVKPELECNDMATDYDYVLYEAGTRIETDTSSVLATATHPYFNRTADKYCSHRQTPPAYHTEEPVMVHTRNTVYCTPPLFKLYRKTGYGVYRDIIAAGIRKLHTQPLIKTDLPSTAEVTMLRQRDRLIVHIFHYIPERRAEEIEVIADVIPLSNVNIAVNVGHQNVKTVYLAPQKEVVDFAQNDCYVSFKIPHIQGHQIVVIE